LATDLLAPQLERATSSSWRSAQRPRAAAAAAAAAVCVCVCVDRCVPSAVSDACDRAISMRRQLDDSACLTSPASTPSCRVASSGVNRVGNGRRQSERVRSNVRFTLPTRRDGQSIIESGRRRGVKCVLWSIYTVLASYVTVRWGERMVEAVLRAVRIASH